MPKPDVPRNLRVHGRGPVPGAPTGLTPTGTAGAGTVTLSWTAGSGATTYDVYFGTVSNPSYLVTTASTTYDITAAAGTTYYWRVVSVNQYGTAPASGVGFTIPSGGQVLLQASDFEFVGMLKLPYSLTCYAWGGLAMRKVGGQIHFFTGDHTVNIDGIHELDCPGFDPVLASAPRATILKSWGGPGTFYTKVPAYDANGVYRNGLWWDEEINALWWTYGIFYNMGPSSPTFGFTQLSGTWPNETFTIYGPWYSNASDKIQREWIFKLPPSFVAAHCPGKPLGMGCGFWSGNVSSSWGPGLIASERPTTATPPYPTGIYHAYKTLSFFPLNRTIEPPGYPAPYGGPYPRIDVIPTPVLVHKREANYSVYDKGLPPAGSVGYWEQCDHINACVWIDLADKRGVVFFAQSGNGPQWYGGWNMYQSQFGFYDYPPEGWGPHTGSSLVPKAPRWWIMDPADLGNVADGLVNSYDIHAKPEYGIDPTTLTAYTPIWGSAQTQADCRTTGAVFDPDTRMLYYLASNAEPGNPDFWKGYNLIHAWHIKE